MNILFHKKTTTMFVTIAVVVFLGWITFLFTVFSLADDVGTLAGDLATKTEESSSLSTIRSAIRNAGKDIGKVDSFFAKTDAVADFVEIIEKEALLANTPIEISAIQLNKNTERKVHSLSINIKSSGSWRNLVLLIGRIETLPYSMYINKVAFTKTNETESLSEWRSTFEIIAHVID